MTGHLHKHIRICLLSLAATSIAQSSSLLFEGQANASGGGFGGNITLLTIQNNGTEWGCMGWNGTAQVTGPSACIGGLPPQGITVSQFNAGSHESNGNNQTQIRTVQNTGATNANQIRFVFNANEGGGGNSTIVLQELRVAFYDPSGNVLWHSGQSLAGGFVSRTFDDPTGQGTSGQVYRLNFLDVPSVQALVFSRPDWAQVRVGAQMVAYQANSGGDNLFVTNNAALGFQETPEPSTWAAMATGLAVVAWRHRRRPGSGS